MDYLYDTVPNTRLLDKRPINRTGYMNDINLRVGLPMDGTSLTGYSSGIPSELLLSKYEETNLEPDEEIMDHYNRSTITNTRPDKPMFEHEETRRETKSGKLDLIYGGHRGEADDPAHPEMFLGFIGKDHQDPRGTNTDPDFKKLREQSMARTRFVPLGKDTANEYVITSGGISEPGIIKRNLEHRKAIVGKMKIFDTQMDNRQQGHVQTYDQVSKVDKQIVSEMYNNPYINHDPREQFNGKTAPMQVSNIMRKITNQNDFTVAKINTNRRKKNKNEANVQTMIAQNQILTNSDENKNKTNAMFGLAKLLDDAAKQRASTIHQQEYGTEQYNNKSKTLVPGKNTLNIKANTHNNEDFEDSQNSRAIKKTIQDIKRIGDKAKSQHDIEDSKISSIIKSVLPTAIYDNGKAKTTQDYTESDSTTGRKTSLQEINNNIMHSTIIGVKNDESVHKYYKQNIFGGDNIKSAFNNIKYEEFKKESDKTMIRTNNNNEVKDTIRKTTEIKTEGENMAKERHIGKIGRKSGAKYLTAHEDEKSDRLLMN